jgi:isopentenyl-diphosphate Delta-isomerase
MSELVDLIDERDDVIGQATKDECHQKGLLHRSVFVFLFDPEHRMILQKRSAKKAVRPNKITAAACGHVHTGEDVEEAAHRELQEELGIDAALRPSIRTMGPYDYDRELISLFVGETPLAPIPNVAEIEEIFYLTIDEIVAAIENDTLNFGDSFKKVFIEYLASNRGH